MISFRIESAGYTGDCVLSDLEGVIREGEFTVILGMNGGGKSTFLRCLAGLHRDMQGRVEVDGEHLSELTSEQRARAVAFLPQSTQPAFAFLGSEVIALARYATGQPAGDFQDDLVAMAEQFGVEDFLSRRVDSLSGGEWQRIALARTFFQDARALLLDEPTAHLDLGHRLQAFDRCRQSAREGKAVLVATHDLDSAFEFADRLLFIKQGRLVADGTPQKVVTPELIEDVFGRAPIDVQANPFSQRPQLVVHQTDGEGR